MDIMKKSLFKRSRSMLTANDTLNDHIKVSDTMTVDLARSDTLPALRELRETPKLSQSVKYATVHAESRISYGGIKLDSVGLVEVFQRLGELPRLQQVTVDLSGIKVHVAALTALLSGAKALRELHLLNLQLYGATQDLDEVLNAHKRLQTVRLMRCSGSAVQSFMTQLPCLKKLEIRYTEVGCFDTLQRLTNPWFALGESTTLQSLTVQELPDMCTNHALDYITALSEQQMMCHSQLQELHMTSVCTDAVNGQIVGQAMADLFLVHSKVTLKTLTLKFGSTWPNAGITVASILRKNPNLTSVCVQLSGRDAIQVQGMAILNALPSNTNLKRLKLCLDRDQHLDAPLGKTFFVGVEELVCNHNHTLQNIVLLDEHREKYPLTEATIHKLELNASKLPAMLYQDATNTCIQRQQQVQQSDYINAMIDSKNSLNVLFYAISNQPDMLLHVNHSTTNNPLNNSSRTSSFASLSESDDDAAYLGKVMTVKRKSPASKAKKTIRDMLSF